MIPITSSGGGGVWPLRAKSDYHRALQAAEKLILMPEGSLSSDDQDRLDIFCQLISSYEEEHDLRVDVSGITPMDMLSFYMSQRSMKPADLGRLLGDVLLGEKIISGELHLTSRHIQILSKAFHCDPAAFGKPAPKAKPSKPRRQLAHA